MQSPELQAADIDPLNNAAQKLFGLSYLFPYQRLVIANIIEAANAAGIPLCWPQDSGLNDINTSQEEEQFTDAATLGRQIVILPTGAGKSLCFQLPAMLLNGATLIIYPILSLMADQERRLAERGFNPVLLRGGQSKVERDAIWQKIKSGQSKVIIANPEVLLGSQVKEILPTLGITHTVIDEAHCVSEWGESFRPSYLELNTILQAVNAPLVTAFTATASEPVLEKISKYIFGETKAHIIAGNPDRPNIEYRALGCILKNLAVRDLLLANARPAIVFCSSRHGTQNVSRYLQNQFAEASLPWAQEVRFYHAGLEKKEKQNIESWFLHNEQAVLVATCAFGLGVDKADIRTVIHRDCPPSVEAYLQESGRAGRDGKQSRAVLLWGPEDDSRLKHAKTAQDNARLQQLLEYARDTKQCRREALLRLLNTQANLDTINKPQSFCCDVCQCQAKLQLREETSLVDFFKRNKRLYTIREATRVLAEKEIAANGPCRSWSEEEAEQALRALLQKGALKKARFPWKGKIMRNEK